MAAEGCTDCLRKAPTSILLAKGGWLFELTGGLACWRLALAEMALFAMKRWVCAARAAAAVIVVTERAVISGK